ncbi:unnamed protein product [Phaeothamnion confervicola]
MWLCVPAHRRPIAFATCVPAPACRRCRAGQCGTGAPGRARGNHGGEAASHSICGGGGGDNCPSMQTTVAVAAVGVVDAEVAAVVAGDPDARRHSLHGFSCVQGLPSLRQRRLAGRNCLGVPPVKDVDTLLDIGRALSHMCVLMSSCSGR